MTLSPPGDLRVTDAVVIPAAEIHEAASRSGGPGGQHVNKSRTRVTLRWNVRETTALDSRQKSRVLRRLAGRLTNLDHLVVHAGQHRSRAQNRELARERLAELVRDALHVARTRVPTKQSKASKRRALDAKRRQSERKRRRRPVRADD